MKTFLLALGATCVFVTACTKDEPPKKADTGTVGKGLGGQTVGTPFAGSVGAGDSQTRGSKVGDAAPGQH